MSFAYKIFILLIFVLMVVYKSWGFIYLIISYFKRCSINSNSVKANRNNEFWVL